MNTISVISRFFIILTFCIGCDTSINTKKILSEIEDSYNSYGMNLRDLILLDKNEEIKVSFVIKEGFYLDNLSNSLFLSCSIRNINKYLNERPVEFYISLEDFDLDPLIYRYSNKEIDSIAHFVSENVEFYDNLKRFKKVSNYEDYLYANGCMEIMMSQDSVLQLPCDYFNLLYAVNKDKNFLTDLTFELVNFRLCLGKSFQDKGACLYYRELLRKSLDEIYIPFDNYLERVGKIDSLNNYQKHSSIGLCAE